MRPVADPTLPPPPHPEVEATKKRSSVRVLAYGIPVVAAALGVGLILRSHHTPKLPLHVSAAGTPAGAPTAAHPRLFLDPATLATLKTQSTDPTKGASLAKTKCDVAYATPKQVEWGFGWAYAASSCALAYQLTGDSAYATKGLYFVNALLDDYHAVGDGLGGDDVVTHDTGYFMRVYAPYAALSYDWLHDAPGMTETLRAKMRGRFAAWLAWYDTKGYLRHRAGANYQAGYLFAATLIAIAEGGEAGPAGEQAWTNVTGTLFDVDMIGQTKPGGALDGGDWAEGWQYGPLSVLEYALSTRALAEQGRHYPLIDKYVSDLVRRYLHASSPAAHGLWIGGDTSHGEWQHAPPNARVLIAAVAGTASNETKARARAEMAARSLTDKESPVFQALADAAIFPAAPPSAVEPTVYVAPSMQTIFARGAWTDTTTWSLFTSGPRLVEDHQHADAGNWVMSRGADNLVVDASPYSSLSSLTSNAPAVDSNAVPPYQTPSQGWFNLYGKTHLVWSRALPGGGAVARGDYADNFRRETNASDVQVALRDFVFLPAGDDGTVVTFDRVKTGDAARGAHFRVTTPGTATVSGKQATATVGASSLRVQMLYASSGSLYLGTPAVQDDCSGMDWGKCDKARFPVTTVKLDVAGPSPAAIIVSDSAAAGAAAAPTELLSGVGYRGVLLTRGVLKTAIIGADSDPVAGAPLTYRVRSGTAVRHIVLDAPRGSQGRSDVTAKAVGPDCEIAVVAASGAGGFDAAPLVIDVAPTCAAVDPGPGQVDSEGTPTTPSSGTVNADGTDNATSEAEAKAKADAEAAASNTGAGCAVTSAPGSTRSVAVIAGAMALMLAARRRRRTAST
jgi:MYXO-CTERM domain-containing protein